MKIQKNIRWILPINTIVINGDYSTLLGCMYCMYVYLTAKKVSFKSAQILFTSIPAVINREYHEREIENNRVVNFIE